MTFQYVKGAELPDFTANFRDSTNAIVSMASGWTFSVKVGTPGSAASFTKSSGVTGGASPSVTVQWATTGELNDLGKGIYDLQITATRTSDGRERIRRERIEVLDVIT